MVMIIYVIFRSQVSEFISEYLPIQTGKKRR